MSILERFKGVFIKIEEKAPDPISKLVSMYNYSDDSPQVSFATKIYYHSISPQIQLGVTAYARLLDLANIQINSDDEASKKLIEKWIDDTNFKNKLEDAGNTFLICGNMIFEKLDEKMIQDVAEVDMSSITAKKRDDNGKLEYYVQRTLTGQNKLGEGMINKFIEFNLNTISRSTWSPCIFEAAAIPRKVGNRMTYPLVELLVGIEDAMSTIVLNNAYPEVYYTFEGANEEQLKKEQEKIRKKKPGDRMLVTKKPQIDLFEAKGQSAYVDYIKYLYNSLSASIKFPVDIINGDFTSRASSETSADLPEQVAAAIKRYIGHKLKNELFDPILTQNGKNPATANLQVTFGIQKTIELTPDQVKDRVVNKIWSLEEGREWDKDNTGADLFDEDFIKQVEQEKKDMMNQPINNNFTEKENHMNKRQKEILELEAVKEKIKLYKKLGNKHDHI